MPSNTFASLGVPEDLVSVLSKQGIEAPFPIQAATLKDALAGRDVSGRAPTGSGKTLAFGLAIVTKTCKAKPRKPHALVLVPTRELAAQVETVLRPLAKQRHLHTATVYGGVGYGDQRRNLNNGTDILVACPGRLEDLMESHSVDLSDVQIAVIDEADRMADMGFLPAVKRILDKCKTDRQTLLFSATLDGDVDFLVKHYQRSPVRHEVHTPEEEQGDVVHHFWRVERHERLTFTKQVLAKHSPVIVFCRTRHGADRLAKQLSQEGIAAAPIHGSRTQPQRDKALADFQSGRVKALIATDVAARGIHVDDVSCVVHFDPPSTDKDYVHRSGRTGRAGADGTVISFVGREVLKDVKILQRQLKMNQHIGRPDVASLVERHAAPKVIPTPAVEREQVRRPRPPHKPYKQRANNPNKPWRGKQGAAGRVAGGRKPTGGYKGKGPAVRPQRTV